MISNDCSLEIELNKFIPTFRRLITDCIEKPWEYSCHFTLDDRNGIAKMRFLLDNEYRTADILTIPFKQLDEEAISAEITYRVNSQKQKTMLVAQRLKDIISILQEHNPAIIEVIQRAVSGHEESSGQGMPYDSANFFETG
jgi:hypothetical protein